MTIDFVTGAPSLDADDEEICELEDTIADLNERMEDLERLIERAIEIGRRGVRLDARDDATTRPDELDMWEQLWRDEALLLSDMREAMGQPIGART